MRYDETQTKSESGGVTKHLWRIAALLILIVAGVLLFQYRDTLSIHISQVLASGEDDPIPVAKLSKQAFSVTVPSTGEVVGLKTTSITTPETTSRGSMKLAWLIPEGSFVQAGDTVVRFDSTDAQLNLEQRQNTLEENQQQTKITTLDQATNEKVLAIDRTDAEMDYEYAMTVMPEDETIFSKWDIITAQADANYAKERIDFLKSKGKTQKRIARSDQQISIPWRFAHLRPAL
jgi:HlyD family secretion protein